ncbi:MAG TPA: ABC transporter ATP-binding protein [Thermoplasmata archaeon]|nr:ABC transporter ATP-binding protein [Thermoplasmata archaeon]
METTPPGPSPTPLSLTGLSVKYGERPAVQSLSLTVQPGEIYGLLGSNGAGKTSTIKAIVGLVRPDAGEVRVFGRDALRDTLGVKAQVGYVPETSMLYEALSPREFLEFVASVRKMDSATATRRMQSYAEAFRLGAELEEPIATLSNGTRQKVLIIAALLHAPPLLILDEPLNSLDPRSVRIMKDVLLRYVAGGTHGVLFSTHTMEVAEQLCQRVGILDRGVLRGEGTLTALRGRVAAGDASLEEIFLRLTEEEAGVRAAVDSLGEPSA